MAWLVPGVPRLAEAVYAWIAANRRRFRGDQPWCARHPEQCHREGASSCGRI